MATDRARSGWGRVLAGLLLVCAPTTALGEELRPVKIGIPTWNMPLVPFVMARDRGLYQAEGLMVDLVVINSPLMPPALVNGELDYAAALGNVLWAAMQGVPLKGLMVIQSRPILSLVARPEITSGADLKGKAIAVSARGTLTDHIAREAARHFGLDPDRDITTLGVGDQGQRIAALQTGRVAAAVLDPPVEFTAVAMGFTLLIRGADFMEDPQIGLITSERKIAERPDEVRRMVRATLQGLRYARTHRAETVAAIERTFKLDREAAERSYDVVVPLLSSDALPTQRSLESLPQTFRTFTKHEPQRGPERVFDLSFLRQILAIPERQ